MGGWDSTVWVYSNYKQEENSTNGIYEFRYVGNDIQNSGNGIVVKAEENTVLDDLFKTITIPGEGVTNENINKLAEVKIIVTAHAIQADGFDTADDAWDAFSGNQSEWGLGAETEDAEGSEEPSET